MNEIAEECDSEAIMWTLRSRAGFSGQEDADPDVPILKEAKAEYAKIAVNASKLKWLIRARRRRPDIPVVKQAKAECAKLMMTCLAAALLLLSLRHQHHLRVAYSHRHRSGLYCKLDSHGGHARRIKRTVAEVNERTPHCPFAGPRQEAVHG